MVKVLKRPDFKDFYEVNEFVAKTSPMMTHYHSHIPMERWLWQQKKKTIKEYLSEFPGKKIVDLGCGDGGILDSVLPSSHYTGIDISPTQVKLAKQYIKDHNIKNTEIKIGDITHTKEKDNTYDVALLFDVVEHVLDTDALFAEAKRITKKNGTIIVSIPHENLWELIRALLLRFPLRSPDHINSISPKDIEEQFPVILKKKFIPVEFSSTLSLIHIFVVKNGK